MESYRDTEIVRLKARNAELEDRCDRLQMVVDQFSAAILVLKRRALKFEREAERWITAITGIAPDGYDVA